MLIHDIPLILFNIIDILSLSDVAFIPGQISFLVDFIRILTVLGRMFHHHWLILLLPNNICASVTKRVPWSWLFLLIVVTTWRFLLIILHLDGCLIIWLHWLFFALCQIEFVPFDIFVCKAENVLIFLGRRRLTAIILLQRLWLLVSRLDDLIRASSFILSIGETSQIFRLIWGSFHLDWSIGLGVWCIPLNYGSSIIHSSHESWQATTLRRLILLMPYWLGSLHRFTCWTVSDGCWCRNGFVFNWCWRFLKLTVNYFVGHSGRNSLILFVFWGFW